MHGGCLLGRKFSADVLILGSGPAGYTAAIYAARGGRKTVLVSGSQPGGQLTMTTEVENYPGFAKPILGPTLMEEMALQAQHSGAQLVSDVIISAQLDGKLSLLQGQEGACYEAKALVVATGASANWLGLPSEETFRGFGVSACATCDGAFYRNQDILVVGGGSMAVEEAIYLSSLARKVYIAHRRDSFRAEKILIERLLARPNVEVLWNTVLDEIVGEQGILNPVVTGVVVSNVQTKVKQNLSLKGVFIAIGHTPNTALFKDTLSLDEKGYIQVSPGTTKTNIEGVFAAGDVMDSHYQQAVTAAGTGCMAALDALAFLDKTVFFLKRFFSFAFFFLLFVLC